MNEMLVFNNKKVQQYQNVENLKESSIFCKHN